MTFEQFLAKLQTEGRSLLGVRTKELGIDVAQNRAYMKGDYWQDGTCWVGPWPSDTQTNKATIIESIKKDFTPIPLINEVVERHVDGLTGKEPAFEMTAKEAPARGQKPSKPTEAMNRANALLTDWWDRNQMLDKVQQFCNLLCTDGEASMRLFIPRERLQSNGDLPKVSDAEAASRLIFADVLTPDVAGILTHRRSMRQVGVVALDQTEAEKDDTGEVTEQGKIVTELHWVEDNGNTKIQIEAQVIEFDNDGQLLVFTGKRLGGPIITEPVKRLQNTLNFENSMLPRNARYAGHRGRHLFNIARPKTKQTIDGVETMVDVDPASIAVGASTFNAWQAQVYDEDGSLKALPASIVLEEPVDSTPIRNDIEYQVASLLRACKQLHVLMSDDATASGVSRIQARAEFRDSLMRTRPAVEAMLRWLLKSVLLLSCYISKDTGFAAEIKQMRASVDVKLPVGNLSPEEKTALAALKTAEIVDTEYVQTEIGVEDVEAMNARIAEERKLREQGAGDPDSP